MKKIARLLTWSMFLALGIHEVLAQQDNIPAPVSFCGSGEQAWMEAGSTCHADLALRIPAITWSTVPSVITGAATATTITGTSGPFCPDDRTLVLTNGGYKCAKDLVDPK